MDGSNTNLTPQNRLWLELGLWNGTLEWNFDQMITDKGPNMKIERYKYKGSKWKDPSGITNYEVYPNKNETEAINVVFVIRNK